MFGIGAEASFALDDAAAIALRGLVMIALAVVGAVSGMLVSPLTPKMLAGGFLAEGVGIAVAAPIAALAVGYYDYVAFDYLAVFGFIGIGVTLLGGGYMVAFVVRLMLADRKAGPRPPPGPLW